MLKLAWRNIWRNRRRTIITAGSIFFAVFFAITARSFNQGAYEQMIENMVGFYTGYGQIQTATYFEEKSINESFVLNDSLSALPAQHDELAALVPRLEYFSLASSGPVSRMAMVLGIDPEAEDGLTGLKSMLKAGDYLANGDQGALISTGLAEYLHLGVGDTLVLVGSGYQDQSAWGLYPVQGLIEQRNKDLNGQMVYLTLSEAQYLFRADGRVTSLVLQPKYKLRAEAMVESLRPDSSAALQVYSWKELMPEMVQFIEADSAGDVLFLGILYMIIAFGIFGTVLMMTLERMHEFGILIAIGMRKLRLGLIVILETLMLAGVGIGAGILAAIPTMLYFFHNPIKLTGDAAEMMANYGMDPVLRFSRDPGLFVTNALIVFVISFLISLYPVWKLRKLKVTEAMRG